mgnify:CR=1 FL=1
MVEAREGQILVDGTPHAQWPRAALAARLAYVRQEVVLFAGSVRDNLTLWNRSIPETDMIAAAHDAQIHATISARPAGYDAEIAEGGSNFSGGEKQRMEIARALASQPHFILLDEPLAGIDPIAVADIRDLVSHLKDRGIGVLITDHNVRETLGICHRACILSDGKIIAQGQPDEILENEQVREVYLGHDFRL